MLSKNYKRRSTHHRPSPSSSCNPPSSFKNKPLPSPSSSAFNKYRQRLGGGRFRSLNEWLYIHSGDAAFENFQNHPHLYQQYHEGYQKQVRQWPINPVNVVIKWLKTIPPQCRIGDFGCGEAQIAARFPKREVLSFDLVAATPQIIACNIANVPVESGALDIAVFCLSLMGSDWPKYIVEAHRCLSDTGKLVVAEVTSRIVDVDKWIVAICSIGFELIEKKDLASYFMILFLNKTKKGKNKSKKIKLKDETAVASESTADTINSHLLQPCLYKKR